MISMTFTGPLLFHTGSNSPGELEIAITRCSCSISLATSNAALYVPATCTAPTAGTAAATKPLSPEVLEPIGRQLGVAHRVLDVLVTEPRLQRPGIVACIRQGIAAAVPQHVRKDREEANDVSFDHLVGAGEHRLWHGQAHRLRGFEVDYQLILGRCLYGKIGRLLALCGESQQVPKFLNPQICASHRFPGIQPNSGRRDYSPSSCDGGRRSSGLYEKVGTRFGPVLPAFASSSGMQLWCATRGR
jgi:hypothetical protein